MWFLAAKALYNMKLQTSELIIISEVLCLPLPRASLEPQVTFSAVPLIKSNQLLGQQICCCPTYDVKFNFPDSEKYPKVVI